MSFPLARSSGKARQKVEPHELVGVEIGRSIDEVANALIKAAADELAALPEYQHCKTAAYAPEPIKEFRRVKRYQYEMMGIVYPPKAEKNILIEFGIVEADE